MVRSWACVTSSDGSYRVSPFRSRTALPASAIRDAVRYHSPRLEAQPDNQPPGEQVSDDQKIYDYPVTEALCWSFGGDVALSGTEVCWPVTASGDRAAQHAAFAGELGRLADQRPAAQQIRGFWCPRQDSNLRPTA
jgi:hypothetical protein